MKDIKEIKGVIPAMFTVFDENENIDEKATKDYVEYLISKKIDGLYLTGSTGEGFLMDVDERKRYVEVVVDAVSKRIPIIVHVGAIGTKISIELAEHAAKVGADAVSSVPPFYWSFGKENIIKYYRDIASATNLPMIVYNVPLAGIMSMDLVKDLIKLPNVKGIKYTATTHHEMAMIKDFAPENFMVYSGCDEMALSGLMHNADGIIGSTYNLMPELFVKINALYQKGLLDEANKYQHQAFRIINELLNYELLPMMKEANRWKGVNAGYCRRPFGKINPETANKAKATFKRIKEELEIKDVEFINALN